MRSVLHLEILLSLITLCRPHVVTIVQGKLRGVTHDGVVSYYGIPYASIQDSTGKFKRAGLAPSWTGVREPQQSHCSTTSAVEDCLLLDVYMPTGSNESPVLVWVTGNGRNYNPKKLVQQGILAVIVYHRLGAIGFLCLGEEQIPGNVGVKDVVTALRWVRDNIVAFRGNPAKVVVAGQGFGAAIVETLTLSPMAQGLFHGIILQSGTVLSPWAYNYDAEERALEFGKTFGDDDITTALISSRLEELAEKAENFSVPYFPFGICLERPFRKEERLLLRPPIDLLTDKTTEVPMIIGYNSEEAYIFVSNLKLSNVLKRMSQDMSILLPEEFKTLNDREFSIVVRKIKDMYFKHNVSMDNILEFYRDAYFTSHIYRSARLHSLKSRYSVFFYQFSYSGAIGVEPEFGVKKTGAAHSDELAYLFSESGRDFEGDDGVVREQLVELWTNFIKYLNPTSHRGVLTYWEAAKPHNFRLLDISSTLVMKDFPHIKTAKMWDDLYQKYYYTKQRTTI